MNAFCRNVNPKVQNFFSHMVEYKLQKIQQAFWRERMP